MELKLLGQRKALVIIVKDDEVQLLTWNQGILNHNAVFAADEQSFDVFGRFLDNHLDFPVIVVADMIEESFRYDSIAHVSVNDRRSILDRKLEYLFRETPYRTSRVTGREQTGRKDDRILFSALTKPELLTPWIKLLIQRNMPIQAITSAPYILEKYAASQAIGKSDDLLLVSLESGSSFRQTFLQNGKVLFSRMSRLELSEGESPGTGIRKETLQVRKYLERVKLLRFSSELRFHVLSPFNQSQIETAFRSSDSFESFKIDEEAQKSPLELHGNEVTTLIVVLAKILQNNRIPNKYAPLQTRRFHILRRASQGLVATAAALLAGVILIKAPGFLNVLGTWEERDQTIAKTIPYQNEYEILTQGFPETPIPPNEMELVVTTALQIQQHSIDPLQTMNSIGSALSESPDLQLTSIRWALTETASDQPQIRDPYGVVRDQGVSSKFRRATFEDRLVTTITIQGIAYSPRSYREAQIQVDSFVNALAADEIIASVVTTKLPTDVRSDTSVSTTVDDAELRASFTVEITLGDNS